MTTPAEGNLSGSSSKQPDAGFEASGLSPEEAERLAAAFKPSWEFDEAPFTQGNGGLDAGQVEALGAVDGGAHENGDARTVAPHAPPQRVETHEPEVSVIIDRSITSAEIDAQRGPPPPPARPAAALAAPFASPAFAAPAFAPPAQQRVAPVMRSPRSPDESLELPASLKKSNKGLFIGLGVAVVAAALVLVVHGAMSSSTDSSAPPSAPTVATAVPTATAASNSESSLHGAVPPIPPPAAVTATPTAAPQPVVAASVQHAAAVAAPTPKPQAHAAPAPPPPTHHAAAPKNPPKAAGGGIVRDVPF